MEKGRYEAEVWLHGRWRDRGGGRGGGMGKEQGTAGARRMVRRRHLQWGREGVREGLGAPPVYGTTIPIFHGWYLVSCYLLVIKTK